MKEILQRVNQHLLFAVLIVIILHFGRTIIIPIVSAGMLSMLMAPVANRLECVGFKRVFATLTSVLILVISIALMLVIIIAQISTFSQETPKIQEKFQLMVSQAQDYVEQKFSIPKEKQDDIAKEQTKDAGKTAKTQVTRLLSGIASTLTSLVLTLVVTFLFLYNREHYEKFFIMLYHDEDSEKVKHVVNRISNVAQKYITGRVFSILIIATLYSIGLSIVGIKNAILLAGIAALLTLIPFLGTILGGLFPVFMALTTEDSIEPAIWAGVVLIIIQTIDNYFIEPNVVGGEVNLGALPTILGIIVGGLIWGAAGMILFIPILGIAKIIFDNVESLKPYGYLIGEPKGDKPSKIKQWLSEKYKSVTKKL